MSPLHRIRTDEGIFSDMWHAAGLEIRIIGVETRIREGDVMLVISRRDASLRLLQSQVQTLLISK